MTVTDEAKLAIYNYALVNLLGSRRLDSLTENRESRRAMDDAWQVGDGLVKYALERGEWNFAITAKRVSYSTDIETAFGFKYGFTKPDDFRRLASISADEYFNNPLVHSQYNDEGAYWLSDHKVLFIKYVSDAQDLGLDSSRWSEGFKEYLAARCAWLACERITNSRSRRGELESIQVKALRAGKSLDAMNEGVKFAPLGSWAASRGARISRHEK